MKIWRGLPRLQNADGGFGWSHSSKSDLYLTSYALLAMVQADAAGFIVPAGIEQAARRSVAAGMFRYAIRWKTGSWIVWRWPIMR